MINTVKTIQDYNLGRDPERLAIKYATMRQNAFSFLRATCHLFHLRQPEDKVLYRAPLAWTCGDMHLENFGSYKGENRLVYFDINDFDEATLAPCTWPLVRLLSSVLVAAPEWKIRRTEALELSQLVLDAYAQTLASGKARWVERDTAEGEVRSLLDTLRHRSRTEFLDSRTVLSGKQRHIRLDPHKALAITDRQREKVCTFMAEFAEQQADPRFYKVLDVARRVSGLGSLGLERYVILVKGKGTPDGNYLLDLKAAQESSLTPCLKTPEPRWRSEAERIVTTQRYMQAIPIAFLHAVELSRKSFVLRDLQPVQDRVNLIQSASHPNHLASALCTMAEVLAWAQIRSGGRKGAACIDELIEFAEKRKWRSRALELAQECAIRVEADWNTYSEAYDAGEFTIS